MTFVVTEACIRCKYTDCVDVCPMACFVEGPNFLAIDPEECIDCSMCVPECPVGAIVADHEIDEAQRVFIEINRQAASEAGWPRITRSREPLPDHEHWAGVRDKRAWLELKPVR